MRITREADYAIRALMCLSRKQGSGYIPIADLVENCQVPERYLRKIVSRLSKRELIHSSRGAAGGVRLGRSPERISVYEVIDAIEGPILINVCLIDTDKCSVGERCTAHFFWQRTQDMLVQHLKATSLAELTDSAGQKTEAN